MNKELYPFVIIATVILTACGRGAESYDNPGVSDAEMSPTQVRESSAEPAMTDTQVLLTRGRTMFTRCKACHTLEEGGRHRVGPNLWAISGATAGQKSGFAYSSAMKNSGVVWTDENLAAYIANPRKFMPKNRMTFAGLRKPEDQAAVIAYIKDKTGPQ